MILYMKLHFNIYKLEGTHVTMQVQILLELDDYDDCDHFLSPTNKVVLVITDVAKFGQAKCLLQVKETLNAGTIRIQRKE